jgi:hypothetical protein
MGINAKKLKQAFPHGIIATAAATTSAPITTENNRAK